MPNLEILADTFDPVSSSAVTMPLDGRLSQELARRRIFRS